MINIVDSPGSYFSLQHRPNRLRSASWTNPFTNKILFEAGITAVNRKQHASPHLPEPSRAAAHLRARADNRHGRVATKVNSTIRDSVTANGGGGACSIFDTMISGSINEAFSNGSGIQVLDDDTSPSAVRSVTITHDDNPATTVVEGWGNITQLVNPRFMRFTMSLNF
jgi:hypothetical protein